MYFFLHIHIVSCVFIIEFVSALLDFRKKLSNRGVLEYVANTCGPWFLMKGAPLGPPLGQSETPRLYFTKFRGSDTT